MDQDDTDARDPLAEQVFAYRVHKDGKVFIYWYGRQVMVLRDRAARQLLSRLEGLDERGVQLALAKVTGNFKRGNERRGQ